MSDNEVWIWCMICERCYTLTEARRRAPDDLRLSLLKCPYSNCGASYLSKGLPWRKVRELFPYLRFPEVPRKSKVYLSDPLRPPKTEESSPLISSPNVRSNKFTTCIRCGRELPSGIGPMCAQCTENVRPPHISKRRQDWWDD